MPTKKVATKKASTRKIKSVIHIKAHSGIEKVFRAIWEIVKNIAIAIYSIIKLALGFVKGILLGVSALLAAVALLIFSIGFLLRTFGISESVPFQESRDFWITANRLFLEQELNEEFAEDQAKLPEQERFKGELPTIITSKTENEKRLEALIEYLDGQEED